MRNWYCIFTKRGYEDILTKRFSELPELEVFNPKVKVKKYTGLRLKEATEGLFPSYIFSKLDPNRYFHLVSYTRGVRRFVGDREGKAHVVDESIIEVIASRVKSGFVQLESPKLNSGDSVMIKEGPFSGLSGLFLEETKATERIMILLNTLQYQAKIELPRAFVSRQ